MTHPGGCLGCLPLFGAVISLTGMSGMRYSCQSNSANLPLKQACSFIFIFYFTPFFYLGPNVTNNVRYQKKSNAKLAFCLGIRQGRTRYANERSDVSLEIGCLLVLNLAANAGTRRWSCSHLTMHLHQPPALPLITSNMGN